MQLSLTQINTFRNCEQQYYYQYIAGLRRKEAQTPLELGSLIHDYLERYYTSLKAGINPDEAHGLAVTGCEALWHPRLQELADLAYSLGQEETTAELLRMKDQSRVMIDRYFHLRGRSDAEEWEIIMVEQPLLIRLAQGIESSGKADLVARELSSGLLYLFEHKTAKTVPSAGYRLRDLQTVLYAEELRQLYGIEVQGIQWNYLRTKLPDVPEPLKNGQLTRRAIDTTWYVYEQAVIAAGQNPEDYADMRDRLIDRELQEFFPRYDYLLKSDRHILIRDFIATANEIARARKDWEAGIRVPVRHLSWQCDRCFAVHLCTAALAWGGTDAVTKQYYTTREERRTPTE